MRLKAGKSYYKLPKDVHAVEAVLVRQGPVEFSLIMKEWRELLSQKEGWNRLQAKKYRFQKPPFAFTFIPERNGLWVDPAPGKNYSARVIVLKKDTL